MTLSFRGIRYLYRSLYLLCCQLWQLVFLMTIYGGQLKYELFIFFSVLIYHSI